MIRVTADTNIFYYLGQKIISKADFIALGEELFATPINVMEIVSKINDINWQDGDSNWNARQQAAKAILDYADEMADEPNRHAAKLCGLTLPENHNTWLEICEIVASASSPDELKCNIDFEAALKMRLKRYDNFSAAMMEKCQNILANPTYSKNGKVSKSKREELWNFLISPTFIAEIFLMILNNHYQQVTGLQITSKNDISTEIFDALAPYCYI